MEEKTNNSVVLSLVQSLHTRFDGLETFYRAQAGEIAELKLRMEVLDKVASHHEDRDAMVHEQHRTSIQQVADQVR